MIRLFYKREWSMAEKILVSAAGVLLGAVAGFLFAPIKKGVYCGNHNGSYNGNDSICEDYFEEE